MYYMGVVIAGDFLGSYIDNTSGNNGYLYIKNRPEYTITKFNIKSYEILSGDARKSASSAITRGAIGAAFLGPVGLLASLSAKKKFSIKIALYWKDGKKSIIELKSEQQYQIFLNQFYL